MSPSAWRGTRRACPARRPARWPARSSAVRPPLDREVHARIHARLEPELRVLNLDFDLRGARGRIEDRRDVRDAAGELLARKRIDLDVRLLARRDAPQILLDDVGHDAGRRRCRRPR